MFRRDPHAAALAQASEVLGRDVRPLRALMRLAFSRGGVLALSRGGQHVFLPLGGVPADGVFELASVTKPFTAALAEALTREDQLAWDTPLRALGGPLRPLPRTLTPLALATHTAGLPAHPARAAVTILTRYHDPYGGMSARQVLSSAARWASPRQAGRFVYSNLGAGVLALACAVAAGEDLSPEGYGRALGARVTGPLGLSQVSLSPGPPLVTPTGMLGSPTVTGFGPLAGAGGLYGTAADLLGFGEAHLSGQAGTHWAEPIRPPGLPRHLSGVAPGWMAAGSARWHDGVARGTRTGLGFDPQTGVVVALLARGGVPLTGVRGAVPTLLGALLGAAGPAS